MVHSLRYTLLACVLALALVASSIASASGPAVSAAKKKHCKAGYHLVTVKKHGKKHKVCKKKPVIYQQG
jgi:Ni/Co efflux regulator RcnB